jgi:hypothetical protein
MPLRVRSGLEDTVVAPGVSVLVLRIQITAALPRLCFASIRLVPVCVLDRTGPRTRISPVVDTAVLRAALMVIGALVMVRSALSRRKRLGKRSIEAGARKEAPAGGR